MAPERLEDLAPVVKENEFELFFERGVTDGRPHASTWSGREAGTARPRDELLGEIPPSYGRVTIEKLAIDAVMAAGRFSVAIPGWCGTTNGSRPVTRRVDFD